MPIPAFNKEAVWFYPRDSKEDGICYYLRDGRQAKHHRLQPLDPHPEAGKGGEFDGMVFLNREPYGDRTGTMGDLVKDWYGPRELVDAVVSVQEVGGGYSSGLLYARGTEPPESDSRIDVKGQQAISGVGAAFTWAWSIDPFIGLAGPSFVEISFMAALTFSGDEVYIEFNGSMDGLENIEGVQEAVDGKRLFTIVRHIDSSTVQIEIPYDASVSPSGAPMLAITYEACYILDGYSDSESAPGVLANLFHLRTFQYRLALPAITHPWDDTLGLEMTRESRLVPSTWMREWSLGYPLAAEGSEEESIGFNPVSKLTVSRQKDGILGAPGMDNSTWNGEIRIQIPKILRTFSFPWGYAWATRDAYVSYDEDWTLHEDMWGPATLAAQTRTVRRIVKYADINATITSEKGGQSIFTFKPETFSLTVGSLIAYSGDNRWSRARVRTFRIGPCLLADGASTEIGPITGPPGPGGTGGLKGSENVVVTGDTVTLNHDQNVSWGSEVLWDIRTTQARFGYWIIDFIWVTLPINPA